MPAKSQSGPPCNELSIVEDFLKNKHGERKILQGLGSKGNLLVTYAGDDRDYTIIMVSPENLACMIDSGTNLRMFPYPDSGVGFIPISEGLSSRGFTIKILRNAEHEFKLKAHSSNRERQKLIVTGTHMYPVEQEKEGEDS